MYSQLKLKFTYKKDDCMKLKQINFQYFNKTYAKQKDSDKQTNHINHLY